MPDKAALIRLRAHARRASSAYASASHLLHDLVEPQATYLSRRSPVFHKPQAAAYLVLVSARMHFRAVDRIASLTGHGDLQGLVQEIETQVPDYKDARDLLEHFEDYAVGAGRKKALQEALDAEAVSILTDGRGLVVKLGIFGLRPIALSQLAWLTDAAQFHAERVVHEALEPAQSWEGYWPMYDYEAPENPVGHDWHSRYEAAHGELRARQAHGIETRLTSDAELGQELRRVVDDVVTSLGWSREAATTVVWGAARQRLNAILRSTVGTEPSWWTARLAAEQVQNALLSQASPVTWPDCPRHSAQHRLALEDDGRSAHWVCPFERSALVAKLGDL